MAYRYYSTERPVTPGSFPKPHGNKILAVENFETRSYVGRLGCEAWGYVEYESPVSEVLLNDFELVSDCENKKLICNQLTKVLQLTRGASDLLELSYAGDDDTELVTAYFTGGKRVINVSCDSGMAMIRDIVNHLGC